LLKNNLKDKNQCVEILNLIQDDHTARHSCADEKR